MATKHRLNPDVDSQGNPKIAKYGYFTIYKKQEKRTKWSHYMRSLPEEGFTEGMIVANGNSITETIKDFIENHNKPLPLTSQRLKP